MIGAKLDQRARRTRHIDFDVLMASLDEELTDFFSCHLYPPRDPSARRDGSPREAAGRSRLVWHRGAPDLAPGDRVEVYRDEATYELLTHPEPLMLSERVAGFQVEVLDIATLYPYAAEVEGASSAEPVPLSLFTGSEEVRGHGDYETYEGESPIEFAETLEADNRVLVLSGQRWRVTSSITDYQVPHVRLQLRKA